MDIAAMTAGCTKKKMDVSFFSPLSSIVEGLLSCTRSLKKGLIMFSVYPNPDMV